MSWLPQYHDMGLIGSYLGVLYCGGTGFYLSPFAFLKNPLVWLQTVSAHRGTHMQVCFFLRRIFFPLGSLFDSRLASF